jgi:hypothetical protein
LIATDGKKIIIGIKSSFRLVVNQQETTAEKL